ncbi:hypothetical protein [Shimia sp.]|uniref:hypothetical protein n=1 Tax=Shimia sp. TaxID=1954381 RepID=UPI003B8CCA0A
MRFGGNVITLIALAGPFHQIAAQTADYRLEQVEEFRADGGVETYAPICAGFADFLSQLENSDGDKLAAKRYSKLATGFTEVAHKMGGWDKTDVDKIRVGLSAELRADEPDLPAKEMLVEDNWVDCLLQADKHIETRGYLE